MRKLEELTLLGDQVLVKCLGTADKQGSIHIPETAREGRKINQGDAGDYLHRGLVLKCGPGDKTARLICKPCGLKTDRVPRRIVADANVFSLGRCHTCGGELAQILDYRFVPATGRAPMPVKVGDVVLYENRRDAELRPTRFNFEGLEHDTFVILFAEQHILALLEDEAVAA